MIATLQTTSIAAATPFLPTETSAKQARRICRLTILLIKRTDAINPMIQMRSATPPRSSHQPPRKIPIGYGTRLNESNA